MWKDQVLSEPVVPYEERRRRIEAREPRVQASRAEALEVGFEARPAPVPWRPPPRRR